MFSFALAALSLSVSATFQIWVDYINMSLDVSARIISDLKNHI